MGRLDDNPTLLQALHNNTPFVYAHLIKFEKPNKDTFKISKNSFKSKKADNYAYITDAGYDISFDDGSRDYKGTANGVQNYVANRVTSVGSFTDTIDLKIANVSLKLDATSIDTSLSSNFAVLSDGASILIESTTSLADAGFRPGDIVKFTSGVNVTESYRVNLIKNSGKTLVTTPINGRGIVAAAAGTGSSSSTLTLAQANSNIVAGMPISGGVFDSLPRTVQSISGTTITLSAALPVMSSSYNYTFGRVTKAHTFIPLTLQLDSQEILGLLHSTAAERQYFTNKTIIIYKAFFYGDAPHTFIGSPVKVFEGTITSASFEEDPSKGTSITWQASTFMNSFNRVNGRITSDAIHRAVTGNRGQPLHTHRPEYAYDLGFMHSENSVSALVNYTDTETYMKYRKKKMGPFGMFGSTRVPYEATRVVERELDLRFDLQAKYLPVVYGVQKIPGIPIFADIAPQSAATNNVVHVFTAHALCEGPIQGIYSYYVDGESKVALDPEDIAARVTVADGKTQDEVNESSQTESIEVTGDVSGGEVAGGQPADSLTTVDASKVTLNGTTTVILTGLHPGIVIGEGAFGTGLNGQFITDINIVGGNTHLTLQFPSQTTGTPPVPVAASGIYRFDRVVQTEVDTGDYGTFWANIPASAATGSAFTNADLIVAAANADGDESNEAVLGATTAGFEADYLRNTPIDERSQPSTTSQSGYTHRQMEVTSKPTQTLEFHMGLPLQDASNLLYTQSVSVLSADNTRTPPKPAGGFLSQDRTNTATRAAYWGPSHTLLDTAYVAASNTLDAEDTTIPELEYIVKGKMINCYNYDGSFEHAGHGAYSGEAHTNFMVGDVVEIKTAIPFTSKTGTSYAANANLLTTTDTRIIEKFEVYQNERDEVKHRYRWDISADEVSLLTEAKRFYMEKSSNKWHMITYDAEDIGDITTDAPGATPVTIAERFTAKVTRTSTSGTFVGTLSDISVATPSEYTLSQCNVVMYLMSDTNVYSDIGTGGYSYSTSVLTADIVAVGSGYELRIAGFPGDKAIPADTKVFIVDQFKLSAEAPNIDDYYNGVTYRATTEYETGIHKDFGVAGYNTGMPLQVYDYVGNTRIITLQYLSIYGVPPVGTRVTFSTVATIARDARMATNLADIGSGDVRSSINYALIALDYLNNTRYGAGIPLDQIDLDSFLLAAQECDTQSEVTVHINGTSSLLTVGSKWRNPLINSNGAEYWQGTIKSINTFNGDTFVTFTNVVGKLAHKANSFQTRQIGELVYSETANDNNLRKITTAGSQRDPATTAVQAPFKFDSSGTPIATFPVDVFTKDRLHADNLGAALFNRNSSAIAQNDSALLLHSLADPTDTVSIKQGVGNPIRTETGESGYSLYDSDAVTFWKYQGWEAPKQRYATRHQGGLTIDTSRPVLDNLKGILNHFNGMLFTAGGKFHLKVEAARDSAGQESDANFDDDNSLLDIKTRYITDEDIIGKISLKDEGFSKSYNTVNASISDPKLHFDDRSVSYFVGEYKDQDSGIERAANFSMPGITNYFNARMAAKQVLDKSRLTRSISFEMRPVGTQILAGDLIRVKYPRFGWDTGSEVIFRVTSVTLKSNCLVNISASEYSDEVYLITRNTKSRFFSDSTIIAKRKVPSVPVFSTPSSASNSSPIVLNWSASTGIDVGNGGYEIWRASSLGNAATPVVQHAELLAEIPANQTTFTDIKAESTTLQTFYYWIRAFNISQQQNTSAKVRAPRRYYSAFNDDASGGQSKVVNAALKALEESLTMSFSTNGITVPADEDGNNPDFSSVNGQITVEIGNNDITNQVTGFTLTNASNFNQSATPPNFVVNASGAYTITGMSGTTASIDVTAAVPANALTGLSAATTITKKFTVNKTKEGAKARVVTLSGIGFNYDETGQNPSPSTAVTTATALNTTGTVYYEFLVNGSSVQNGTSNTFTYTPQALYTNMATQVIQVKIREGSNSSTPLATASLVPTAFRKGDDGVPGAAGADGSAGTDARSVNLVSTKQSFVYDTNNANPNPSSATVNAIAFNTTGTVYYEFFKNDSSVQNSTSASYSYTPQTSYTNMPDKIEVQIREGSGSGTILARDQLTLFGVKAGSDAATIILTNEAHTLPTTSSGVVTYSGSGTDIKVFLGATPVPYDGSSPHASPSFRVSDTGSGISRGTPTTVSTYTRRYPDHNTMTANNASVTYTIIVKDAAGVETTFTKIQSLSKSIQGADGSPGSPGAAGLRTIQGYLYYEKTSAGAPTAPSGTTYTFSTGVVSGTGINDSGTTNVWRNSPTTQDATSTNLFWTVRYFGTESSAGSSTITVGYTNVVQAISFTGVVTFSGGTLTDGSNSSTPLEASDVGSSGSTTIDGGRITTGSIKSQNHSGTGDGSGFSTAGTKFNLNNGTISAKEFRIDSSGNASFSGDLSAAGGTFSGSLVVGGGQPNVAVSTVVSGAAAGATANQDSTSTILAGNHTGNIDGASASTVKSGAAAGATALQDGDTSVELSLNDGAVGPVTIDPTGKLYQGTGTYNNTNTGFYLDSSGNFSLKDKLSFNGTNLSINGSGTFSGNLNAAGGTFNGSVSIGSGNSIFKANTTGIQLGHANFSDAPFSVTSAGALKARSGDIGQINIGDNKLYIGTGSHNNSNTKFYVDSSGNFSLGDKLSWNGTTLSVSGNISVAYSSITGTKPPTDATNDDAADDAQADADIAKDRSQNFNSSGNINGGITMISGGSITVGNIVIDGTNSRILISD